MKKLKIIDLFSGCGGFGLGAKYAGFDSAVAVDIDSDLQSAYKLNFTQTHCVNADICDLDSQAWRFLIGDNEIDGVIGGPPCQGFSRIGKNDQDDPRRGLMFHFFRCVNLIKPKFFIMENVEGLLDVKNRPILDEVLSHVDKRYSLLGPLVLDASKFGAPTKRRRVVVIGYNPQYVDQIVATELLDFIAPLVNVHQAIGDLPSPVPAQNFGDEFGWGRYLAGGLSNYARQMRLAPPKGMGSEFARTMQSKGMVSGLYETIHTKAVIERFNKTVQGRTEPTSRYPRLDPAGFCPTLRAGTGKDKGNFQAMRPIHYSEPRVITVREAARLQGFPDWFLFHPSKWHSFRMIGNSVSPVLSCEILKIIKSKITATKAESLGKVAI